MQVQGLFSNEESEAEDGFQYESVIRGIRFE